MVAACATASSPSGSAASPAREAGEIRGGAAETSEPRASETRSIAQIHSAKCGSCHVPVGPGTRSREQIESAMSRHGKRLKLTPPQWIAMIDYLSPPMGSVQAKTNADQNVR
jgi:hypothetical protein